MVKMSKNDIFSCFFFKFEKSSLSQFRIKLHLSIYCHVYALMNETHQDELIITKGVP